MSNPALFQSPAYPLPNEAGSPNKRHDRTRVQSVRGVSASHPNSPRAGSGAGGSHSPLKAEVASIIAQTDASGQQCRAPDTVEDRLVTSEGDEDSGFLGGLFRCCGCGGRGEGKGEGEDKEGGDRRRNSDDGGRNSSIGMTSSPYATRRPAHWPKPQCMPNLGDVTPGDRGKNCLLLDLDETLVHSSTEYMPNHDYKIPVEIDGTVHTIYVLKRPGVDEFLRRVKPFYEVIVFTASLSKYADPLLDLLDVSRVVSKRLFREHCVFYQGHFVKDLSVINRAPNTAILVDNSPQSYAFQPENAIDCSSFIDDPADTELWRIADFLEGVKDCADVRTLCRHWREWLRQHPGRGKY